MGRDGRGRIGGVCAAGGLTVAAGSWLVLAVGHLDDRYGVDQASGAALALAERASHGTLYPELFDGTSYAGTRYMPLGTVLHAAALRVHDDLLVTGKLLSILAAAAIAGLVVATLRRLATPWVVTLGLTGVLVASRPFVFTAFDARSDALAVALQLGSLLLLWSRPTRAASVGGGVLAALAVLTKFTAVWAAVAGAVWLWKHRRRDLGAFVLAAGVTAVVLGVIAMVWSGGRMVENIAGLGAPGILSTSAPADAARFLEEALRFSGWPTIVLLLGGGGAWLLGVRRSSALGATPYAVAAATAAVVTVAVFTDWGAWINHLLDLTVLSVLTIGALAADHRDAVDRRPVLAGLVTGGLAVLATATVLLPDVADVTEDDVAFAVDPLAGVVEPGAPILVENAFLALESDQRPVVLDPYMYRFVAEDHPDWDDALVGRIDDQEFAAIVLDHDLEDTEWYEHFFSPGVLAAIDRSYELSEQVGEHRVFTAR